MRELSCGPLEYNPALFGLGEVDSVERVTVRWPSGKVQLVHDPAVGGIVTVVENDDQDGDGAVDTQDNCLVTANENQIDSDDDGNACDGDGTVGVADFLIFRTCYIVGIDSISECAEAAHNGDGNVNELDFLWYRGLHRMGKNGTSGTVDVGQ